MIHQETHDGVEFSASLDIFADPPRWVVWGAASNGDSAMTARADFDLDNAPSPAEMIALSKDSLILALKWS